MKSVALLLLCGFLVVCFLVFSSRTSYTHRTLYILKVVAELVIEDLVGHEVLLKNFSSPMSDYEEDSIDAQNFSNLSSVNSLGGAYRADATDQLSAVSGITVKMPPFFDGSISWFKYEEVIDDWLDLTQHEAGKTWTSIRRWSQIFHGYFETSLHQRSSECFPPVMFLFMSCEERKHGDGQVDGTFFITPQTSEGFLDVTFTNDRQVPLSEK